MLNRHAIQVLRSAGHTQTAVAAMFGVTERAVRNIEREAPVSEIDDGAERRRRKIGRPSKVDAFRPLVERCLKEDSEMPSVEILRRALLEGYEGKKTMLFGVVRELRPTHPVPVVRFEGLPGEFTQHDFGHVDVRFVDGTRRRIHFFGSRLKYSRWVEVSIVEDEGTETLCRTLVSHFGRMGGVPLLAVFDRPKTVVLREGRDGAGPEYNPTFGQVMLELGVGVELCTPRRGQEKGAVENLVKWVKNSFFKPRRFVDMDDVHRQLADWHEEVNTRRPSRATGETPEARMADERRRLRALRVLPADLALRYPIFVGPTGFVTFETCRYSMPPESIGIAGTLYLYEATLKIVAARFEAKHPRIREKNGHSTLPEHRAGHVASVSGRRGKLYLKRQQLLELGPTAFAYLTELVHRRPRAWNAEVEQLHQLLTNHGEAATLESMERALTNRTFGSEYVAHHLYEGLSALSIAVQQGGVQ